MTDTIFAISSGAPPAAIAVIRVSGPEAGQALLALAGRLPVPRRATYATLRDGSGEVLDRALVLWLPGPATATGEDVAELHCHGGRAVCAGVEAALAVLPGLRRAEAGEFTRRAFLHGRIDLAEAEGLADLLSAETELQRRAAMAMAGGAFSGIVAAWRDRVLTLSAAAEVVLDFGDEDDASVLPPGFAEGLKMFHVELFDWLNRPRAEALESEAAITAPIAGTTRDVLVRPVAISGVPFQFLDTAGLREESHDAIELIGIARAREALDQADLVLWLGPEGEGPATGEVWEIAAQVDRVDAVPKRVPRHRVSALTRDGIDLLRHDLVETARLAMPTPGQVALNERQSRLIAEAAAALDGWGVQRPRICWTRCSAGSASANDVSRGTSV